MFIQWSSAGPAAALASAAPRFPHVRLGRWALGDAPQHVNEVSQFVSGHDIPVADTHRLVAAVEQRVVKGEVGW